MHWGADQANSVVVPELLDNAFGLHSLDLVVDDASHLLALWVNGCLQT
jgi:hypothetical protein